MPKNRSENSKIHFFCTVKFLCDLTGVPLTAIVIMKIHFSLHFRFVSVRCHPTPFIYHSISQGICHAHTVHGTLSTLSCRHVATPMRKNLLSCELFILRIFHLFCVLVYVCVLLLTFYTMEMDVRAVHVVFFLVQCTTTKSLLSFSCFYLRLFVRSCTRVQGMVCVFAVCAQMFYRPCRYGVHGIWDANEWEIQ